MDIHYVVCSVPCSNISVHSVTAVNNISVHNATAVSRVVQQTLTPHESCQLLAPLKVRWSFFIVSLAR